MDKATDEVAILKCRHMDRLEITELEGSVLFPWDWFGKYQIWWKAKGERIEDHAITIGPRCAIAKVDMTVWSFEMVDFLLSRRMPFKDWRTVAWERRLDGAMLTLAVHDGTSGLRGYRMHVTQEELERHLKPNKGTWWVCAMPETIFSGYDTQPGVDELEEELMKKGMMSPSDEAPFRRIMGTKACAVIKTHLCEQVARCVKDAMKSCRDGEFLCWARWTGGR